MRAQFAKHRDFVRGVGEDAGCIVCGNNLTIDVAHIRYSDAAVGRVNPGRGAKSCPWVLPVCRACHELQHAYGNEKLYWHHRNINPNPPAAYLWLNTGNHVIGCMIIRAARE